MDIAFLMDIVKQLFSGLASSFWIFVLTLVFSMPLGLLITYGRMSKFAPLHFLAPQNQKVGKCRNALANFKPIQFICKIFIAIVRGTPLMLQLFAVFYAPYYLFQIPLSSEYRFTAVIIGFSINYAAYFAEIYRSGIISIPVGQYEAATVLGYNKAQTFFHIIFPQMCKRIIPPVTNEAITLVKDTAMAFVISYPEMFTIAKQISAAKTSILPLVVAGVFYFVFNAVVAFVMERIEKRMSYYR